MDVLVMDLERNIKLLGTPERAQVLLAAMQSQLLGDSRVANTLIPRACNAVLAAPSSTRHVSETGLAVETEKGQVCNLRSPHGSCHRLRRCGSL
jgi:hypothetical protein